MNAYEPMAFGGRVQYVEPKFKFSEVNAAGRVLVSPSPKAGPVGLAYFDEQLKTYEVVSNWRASHHRPLNTFYMALKSRAETVDPKAIASQRIKRLESIIKKLQIQKSMNLSQMQDIGGCRAVLTSIEKVKSLEKRYTDSNDYHDRKSAKDYIASPKASGYRGIHLIYRYKRRQPSSHDGLQVEIQLRTHLQHVWATAVEAAGTFTNQALKSSQGSEDWQRFFALVSSEFAVQEGCAIVPGTPAEQDLRRKEIQALVTKLHVIGSLQGYSATLEAFQKLPRMKYYLMELDPTQLKVDISPFSAAQTKEANDRYTALEREVRDEGAGKQVVLVSVESIQALRQAYPNYFLDTTNFVMQVQNIIA